MADPTAPSWDPLRTLGPERLAAVLSVLLAVAVIAAASWPAGPGDDGSVPEPTPPASVLPSATPLVEPALIESFEVLHARLVATGDALRQELLATQLETPEIATLLRNLNANARFGIESADRLGRTPRAADLAGDLRAYYEELIAIAGRGLGATLSNTEAYRSSAAEILVALERLAEFDERLQALHRPGGQVSPRPSAPPSASVPPSASAPPSASPPASATAEPTPAESSAPPTAPPTRPPGETLDNAGFEQGVDVAWELHVESGSADLVADADPYEGFVAARVEITGGTDVRSGITLRQAGVRLSAGTRYVASVALRAEVPREVRVRIASDDAKVYGTRLFSVGTEWQVYAFDFLPFESDSAYFELGLGRSDAAVSVDAASLRIGSAVEP
jgi:hypothetical protein